VNTGRTRANHTEATSKKSEHWWSLRSQVFRAARNTDNAGRHGTSRRGDAASADHSRAGELKGTMGICFGAVPSTLAKYANVTEDVLVAL
jgi:hypothetical protein